ncbi:MAG TPA: hypothetical protein VGW32_07280 [Pyrinomonadaceae bacterium]|nr:hypothetical protein [Pyrinomonadaceae bacterium]
MKFENRLVHEEDSRVNHPEQRYVINMMVHSHQCLVLVALCVMLLSGAGLRAQTQTTALDWQLFKSEAGGFTVKFPGTPAVNKLPAKRGPVTFTRNTHSLSAESFVFHVEYSDYPKGHSEPSVLLAGGISALKHTVLEDGGRLLQEGAISRTDCEGREATFLFQPKRPDHPQFWHGRVFASGHRFYVLVFTADEDSAAAREVGRTFLDSFNVPGGCTSVIAPTPAPDSPAKVQTVEGTPDRATGWRRIESNLGFSVLMPGAATQETEQTQVEPFPITHNTFSYETKSSIFSVETFGEYPRDFHSNDVYLKATLDLMLATVKETLEPVGFTITPLRELNLGRFPGREFSLSHNPLGKGRMQIYVTPTYIFIVIAVAKEPDTAPSSVNRFFDSLRISPK